MPEPTTAALVEQLRRAQPRHCPECGYAVFNCPTACLRGQLLRVVATLSERSQELEERVRCLREECAGWERGADEELARAWRERAEAAEARAEELEAKRNERIYRIRELEGALREIASFGSALPDREQSAETMIARAALEPPEPTA